MTTTINASTSSGAVITSDTSGDLAIQNNGSTTMTVTGGNVGIGNTSPDCQLSLKGSTDGVSSTLGLWNTGASGHIWKITSRSDSSLRFADDTVGAERMRITSSGAMKVAANGSTLNNASTPYNELNTNYNGDVGLYISNQNSSSPYGMNCAFTAAAPNNSSNFFLLCQDNSTNRFVALSNGGLKNYQANNVNLSDQREKKDIELAGNYLDKLCQVPVKTFLYNDQTDTDLNVGVIAQDLQSVCPELVTETNWANKDEPEKMRLSVYETDLKYAMLKAIQELKAELDATKAEVAALKGTV